MLACLNTLLNWKRNQRKLAGIVPFKLAGTVPTELTGTVLTKLAGTVPTKLAGTVVTKLAGTVLMKIVGTDYFMKSCIFSLSPTVDDPELHDYCLSNLTGAKCANDSLLHIRQQKTGEQGSEGSDGTC